MADFDQHHFAAQAFVGVTGIASLVAASTPRPGAIIDAQRLHDHEILNARLARMRSRLACRRAEAALASIDADADLRRAAIYAANRQE